MFASLWGKGSSITSFLNDTLLSNRSSTGCVSCVQDTIALLRRLGFCINVGESVLQPIRSVEYLGNIVDTVRMTVSFPERWILRITQACKMMHDRSRDRIREVPRVIGLLVAAIPAVELGKLH